MARPSEYTVADSVQLERGICGIYALLDADGNIRYVGQSKCIYGRYKQHCRLSNNCGSTIREQWLSSLITAKQLPGLEILERTDDLDAAEIAWIEKLRSTCALTNIADGGKNMGHLRRAKVSMPWGAQQAPMQKALISVRATIKMLRRLGQCQAAERLEDKANRAQLAIVRLKKSKGVEGWIVANQRFAARRTLEINQGLSK